MKKNDKRIMELKTQIAEKKEKLSCIDRFKPITSCILPSRDGARSSVNIHTLTESKIIEIMVDINMRLLSAKDLGVDSDYKIAGFNTTDWIVDLKGRLAEVKRKEEEKKLKLMEDKLTQLLSEDKKTELEIEELADML